MFYVDKIGSHDDILVIFIEHNLIDILIKLHFRPWVHAFHHFNSFSYDVDTASPTTEFPLSRYTRLSMCTGTPVPRNSHRGAIDVDPRLLEPLYTNREDTK